jgi:hypothetical protein
VAKTLLLNWVYYKPVGHVVEGLKIAKGYAVANRDLEVHAMFNADAPVELADGCPWVTRAYAIDAEDVAKRGGRASCLRGVPREWDYVARDPRAESRPKTHHAWLRDFHAWGSEHLHGRAWGGSADERFLPESERGVRPRYRLNPKMTLRVPPDATRWARRLAHRGPLFTLLPCGSSPAPLYPSLRAWDRLVGAIFDAFPNARVVVTGADERSSGRSTSAAFSRAALDPLFAKHPQLEDAYNVGLWNQIALLAKSSALVAPHTGFAFLAPVVGTPWLAISGGLWPEFFFNDVPFVSVTPDCKRYPCHGQMKKPCMTRFERGRPVLCMDDAKQRDKLPEVIAGLRRLLDPSFDYEAARKHYLSEVRRAGYDPRQFFTHDLAMIVT